MPTDQITRRADQVRFNGRILFLTEDTSLIRRQLEATGAEAKALEDELAQRLMNDDLPLINNISTDEITPGWVCFYYDETLGQYVYVALRDGAVKKDEVKNGGFRGGRLRPVQRLRFVARNRAVRREVGRHSTRDRQKHREDLRTEFAEHWTADFDRFRID